MTWFEIVPTLLAAVAVVFLPGAVLARALGARGITWLALSAPLTMTLAGLGAVVAQMTGMRWTPIAMLLLTIGATGISWAIRYFVEIRRRDGAAPLVVRPSIATIWGLVGGLAVASGILGWRLTKIFMSPENISQTYDNVFHLNAVRFILDTGDGSSLYLGDLKASGNASFYPGGWHDLVALVAQLTGTSIPISINAVNMVLASLVWTISAMFLATRVLGSRPAVYWLTGTLAGAFSAFPYLLLDFGVLYPNFLAITLLPAAIGLVVNVLRLSKDAHPGTIRSLILLTAMLPGLALSHPSIAMVLGAFALPIIVLWLFKQLNSFLARDLPWTWLLASLAASVAYWLILQYVWDRFRPSAKASFWPPTQTIAQSLGEAVANAPMGRPVSWTIVGLTVVGIYALIRSRKNLWLLGAFGVGVFLYVVVSGFEKGELRSSISGVFYNDSYRLAALLPVAGIVVAVFGAIWLFDLINGALKTPLASPTRQRLASTLIGTLALLGLGIAAQDNSVDLAANRAQSAYKMVPDSRLLSSDEAALIARTEKTIPGDATVIVNPTTGASLVYALENRKTILPAVGSRPTREDDILLRHLNELATNSEVCQAVQNLDAFYVLDFGAQQINDLDKPFPTSEQLETTPGLTLLDQEGPAKLFRIDGCAP